MEAKNRIFINFILTQFVLLSLSCSPKTNDPAQSYPGAVPSVLPGATIISQETFKSYLDSGRFAPYRNNSGQTSSSNGGGTSPPFIREDLEGAAKVAEDLLSVNDYVAIHPEYRHIKVPYTHPRGWVETVDSIGKLKRIQVLDHSYKIASVAHSIRSMQKLGMKGTPVAKITPKGILKKIKGGRGLASVSIVPPVIQCPSSELGHGIGLDTGQIPANQDFTKLIFQDGIISNFDWPLKNVASCIKDQGIRGSCTAFAIIAAMELLIAKNNNLFVNFSEQGLYFLGKGFLDPSRPNSDGFAAIYFLQDFIKNPNHRVSYEKAWDYNLSPNRRTESDFGLSCDSNYKEFCSQSPGQGQLNCTPPTSQPIQCGYLSQVQSSSEGGVITAFRSFFDPGNVTNSLDQAIDFLNQGVPVIVETTLTHGFYNPNHGYVPEPSDQDRTEGGHSTLAVGYVSEAEMQATLPARAVNGNGGFFIIKNSWGPTMGDGGYFYVSYNYLVKYVYSLFAIENVNFIP